MSDQDADYGTFIVGFVIGGLVGAVTALLLAPQSGEETRTIIIEKGTEIKNKAADSATQAIEEARVRADEYASTAKQRVSEIQARSKGSSQTAEEVELPAEEPE